MTRLLSTVVRLFLLAALFCSTTDVLDVMDALTGRQSLGHALTTSGATTSDLEDGADPQDLAQSWDPPRSVPLSPIAFRVVEARGVHVRHRSEYRWVAERPPTA
jgi:hypothetical protein